LLIKNGLVVVVVVYCRVEFASVIAGVIAYYKVVFDSVIFVAVVVYCRGEFDSK